MSDWTARAFWSLPSSLHWLVEKLFGWEVIAWVAYAPYGDDPIRYDYEWRRVNG